MTLPSFRGITKSDNAGAQDRRKEAYAVLLAVGTGLLLTGLGQIDDWLGITLTVIGLVVMALPLHKLLPHGTFTVKRGLPVIIVTRALYISCYFATESYVVLGLTKVKGISEDNAGLLVAAGALSWSTAAWLQARIDKRDQGTGRKGRITLGLCIMLVGIGLIIISMLLPGNNIAMTLLSQIITGFGVGLATPTTGAIALQQAEEGKEGEVSATLQFVDSFSIAVNIGLCGAIVALSESFRSGIYTGIMIVLTLQICFVLLSLIASSRIAKKSVRIAQSSITS